MAGRWQTIAGPDGRALRVIEAGDPAGVAVLVHHGSPSGGLLYAPWAADAAARGIRLISYDRPGYGGSDRDPGRTVAAVAADAAAVADALGVERFATWGMSGGGPHALACAALLGGRVTACATLASVAPRDAAGLDFVTGMGEDNVREFEAAFAGEDALRPLLDGMRRAMLDEGGVDFAESAASILSPGDVAALGGPIGAFLAESFRAALAGGIDGWLDDDLAFVRPWGFDPADIKVPVQVWQGRQDRMVPYAHGEWLTTRISAVDPRLSPDDGHVTLAERRVGDVHAFLRERL